MNTLVNKISLAAIALFSVVALGVSLTNPKEALHANAAGSVTVYDYTTNTDSGFTGAVAPTANWVLTDVNDTSKQFSLNIGQNNYSSPNSTTILGGTTSTTLTGTLPGQFVYGNPSLKALATTANINTTKKLYGFRMNSDLDLTNYRDITVSVSWSASGLGTYTGFLAKSTAGSSESWSLLSPGKQSIDCTIASSLSFTDTTNTVLMGQGAVRFALIFGGAVSRLAMKNIKISISANPRKTLNSVGNGSLNMTRDYHVSEALNLNTFDLTANFAYPTSSVTILGSDSRVSFSVDNFTTTISKTAYSFSTSGNKTLHFRLVDTTLTAGVNNSATASMIINIGDRVLTGLEVIDGNTTTLYKYDLYQPSLAVYPLYGSATVHESFDAAFSPSDYTTSFAAGTMLSSGTHTNTVTLVADITKTKAVTITVSAARDLSSPTLILSGHKTSFFLNDPFDITGLAVTGDWPIGNDTLPTYANTNADGTFNVSKTPGTVLGALGNEIITVTYFVNGSSVTTTYSIAVENRIFTFFNHAFSDGTEWGATTTPVNGAITNRDGTLTNSISGWTASTTWVLNTTINPSNPDNGAFYATTDVDANLLFLRFGTASAGPATVSFEGKNFPAITNPENTLNGISRMTIDADAGAAGTLTVSVAGVAPSSYAINYGTPVASSTAPMAVGQYQSYTFYFPYTVIGKIRVSFTNAATPGYFDIGNFSVIGYNLSLDKQVETFATMLNNTDTCSGANYTNLKLVYDYLSSKGVSSNLASYLMDSQPAVSGYSTPNALQLWNAYSTRWGSTGFITDSSESLENSADASSILIIGILGMTAIAGYFFLNEKRRKSE